MNDFFNEQLVKRNSDSKDKIKKIIIGGLSLVGCLVLTFAIPIVGLFVGVVFLGCGGYFISMLDIEYEYIMTNDIIEIDCIYAKRKRKKVIEFNVKDIIAMVKVTENKEQHTFNTAKKTIDFTSNTNKDNGYKAIIKQEENIMIKFEPNEKILEAIRRYNRNI